MKLDSDITLALSIHSNPGIYALLLGSGVSRAAKIPTGWEVVNDLITRIAAASGTDANPKPDVWFESQFKEKPTYSKLIEMVGQTQAERSSILRSYFEYDADKDDETDKKPTIAHLAIAKLVKSGAIRVILTTNFDRLMERALDTEGISPSVISSSDGVEGAIPLAHAPCTIVKLHGDYLDLRTRNTEDELRTYDPRIDSLLDRVFDEYGLVTCGWSGDWDIALRNAMYRRKNRRYTTWWATRGNLTDEGIKLRDALCAQTIEISNADQFFEQLVDKLIALNEFNKPHPISVALAATITKKYMTESPPRIKLYDLIMSEVEQLHAATNSPNLPMQSNLPDNEYAKRILTYDALSEILLRIASTACFWDEKLELVDVWIRALTRLANPPQGPDGSGMWMLYLRYHPARLLLYSTAMAYLAKSKFSAVYRLLLNVNVKQYSDKKTLAEALIENYWMEAFKKLPNLERNKIPVSQHVYSALRPSFSEIFPDETEYAYYFNEFEICMSFFTVQTFSWVYPGRYMFDRTGDNPLTNINNSVETLGAQSEILRAGFCGGDVDTYKKVFEKVISRSEQIRFF